MTTKLISIAYEDWEALKEIAEENSRSMAKQVRAWIREYRESHRELTAQEYCDREPMRTYLRNAIHNVEEGKCKVCHSAEELFRELGI